MTTTAKTQKQIMKIGLYYDDKDDLRCISPKIDDLVWDIALGITNNQSIDYEGKISLGDTKKQKYTFKTDTIKDVNITVADKLKEIHESYRWKGDTEFISGGISIKLIEYPTYGEMCTIKFKDRDKTANITKRGFREWWEDRNTVEDISWGSLKCEQLSLF